MERRLGRIQDISKACELAMPEPAEADSLRARFNLHKLTTALLAQVDRDNPDDPLAAFAHDIDVLGKRSNALAVAIVRSALVFEPVKLPGATTTLLTPRWVQPPSYPDGDPRFATVEMCVEVVGTVTQLLRDLVAEPSGQMLVEGFLKHRQVAYELPIDYIERPQPGQSIHRGDNFRCIDSKLAHRVIGLRRKLLSAAIVGDHQPVFAQTYSKIRTKAYLTDRVLTGKHKTNREKRWECHPDSVHFALRRTCMEIELLLINQLCHFEGFPTGIAKTLSAEDLLLPIDQPFRCPVTLEPMSFTAFSQSMEKRTHGISIFQVGHLDPLKLQGNTYGNGHSPSNISWISEEGNRIQGSLSLDATRDLLRRIWANYEQAGLLDVAG